MPVDQLRSKCVASNLQIKQVVIGALFAGMLVLVGAIAVEGYHFGTFLRSLR
jgi:hypothetical protein